ncbi:MAG: phosphodiesterase [Burkholderiaceae bacterium]|nr:phosphodiesterase [Microbacteriaceae bacterium]
MIQLGQYPAPAHTIAHFSDPHFLAGNRELFGAVDTQHNLAQALSQLERSGARPEAIVFTGDLADLGEPEAYARLLGIVDPIAARMGATIVWVMGNHDERVPFEAGLFGGAGSTDPQDRVYDFGGLRVIALDTSVPGYHHGELSDAQLDWLAAELAVPAPHGTLLAMHHPPVPTPLEVMAILELREQPRLADVLRGTDVRGILGGHLHYSTHSMFAGIPVSVSSATCYTLDISAPPSTMTGVGGGQSFSLVHVYDDRVVHSTVPVGDPAKVSEFTDTFLAKIAAMSAEERLDTFSRKSSTVTVADVEAL